MNRKTLCYFFISIVFIFTSCATIKFSNNQKPSTENKSIVAMVTANNETVDQLLIKADFIENENKPATNFSSNLSNNIILKDYNSITNNQVELNNYISPNNQTFYEPNKISAINVLQNQIDLTTTDTLPTTKPKHKIRKHYYILKAGFTKSLFNNSTGTLNESFPYTSTDLSNNVTTAKTFNGSIKYAFSSSTFIDLANLEFVNKKHYLDLGLGINSAQSNEYAIYFKMGYGFVFPINFLKWNNKPFLLFKPGADVLFTAGYNKSFGKIDNNNKVINLLGYEADEQFTLGSGTDDDPYETYNSNVLDVTYKSSRTFIAPKIAITNRPTGRFYCGIDASWFVPISQNNSISLTQDDGDGHQNDLGSADFNKKGTITTLNNSTINKAPLIGGISVSVTAGVYLWPAKKIKPAAGAL